MDVYVKVSGVWKRLDPSSKVSGSWKAVKNGFVKVSGTWKQFFSDLTLVGGARGSSDDSGNFTVGFRFNRDGTVEKLDNGSWVSSGVWIDGAVVPTDIGDSYEIQVSFDSGDTEVEPVLADGVYRTIDTTRTYSRGGTAGVYSGNLSFTVREIADTSNSATGSWTHLTIL